MTNGCFNACWGGARVYINIGVGMGVGVVVGVKYPSSTATPGPAHSHLPSQHISLKLGMYEFVQALVACFHPQVYMCHICIKKLPPT